MFDFKHWAGFLWLAVESHIGKRVWVHPTGYGLWHQLQRKKDDARGKVLKKINQYANLRSLRGNGLWEVGGGGEGVATGPSITWHPRDINKARQS